MNRLLPSFWGLITLGILVNILYMIVVHMIYIYVIYENIYNLYIIYSRKNSKLFSPWKQWNIFILNIFVIAFSYTHSKSIKFTSEIQHPYIIIGSTWVVIEKFKEITCLLFQQPKLSILCLSYSNQHTIWSPSLPWGHRTG